MGGWGGGGERVSEREKESDHIKRDLRCLGPGPERPSPEFQWRYSFSTSIQVVARHSGRASAARAAEVTP